MGEMSFRAPSVPVYEPLELVLELRAIRRETSNISSFDFAPKGLARPLRFHPGQALTLKLDFSGETHYRTFTIASTPTRPGLVTLTVKAPPDGHATRWMHETLRPGMKVSARGPVGRFSVVWHHAPKLLLISAGSGATPMISMLRWLEDRRENTNIVYLHVAHSPEDLLFRDELAGLSGVLPNLKLNYLVTTAPESWPGPTGHLTRKTLKTMVPDLSDRETFCCGPAPFMTATEAIFGAEGGDADRFHTETFGATEPAIVAPMAPIEAGTALTIALARHEIQASPEATVLAAALAANVIIPTGCRNGVCGTCRLHKTSGEVEMHHNGGLSDREEREGYILACCSRPRSDLVLEMPAR